MKLIFLTMLIASMASTHAYSQCACCAGAGTGSSNGDYNNGILTLPKKRWVVEAYVDYRTIKHGDAHSNHSITSNHQLHNKLDHGSDAAETNAPSDSSNLEEASLKTMTITSLGVRYGITNKITVSALLPYILLQTPNGNDRGMGDLILLGTFNLFSRDNFNVALQGGVELPTGIQQGSNFDNTTVVLGSGSFDPMAGVLVSKRWNKFSIQANGLYKHTNSGFHKNYYGSISTQNLSLSYQLIGNNIFTNADTLSSSRNTGIGWNIYGGYYGEWLDKIMEEHRTNHNSGYYLGFANLGTNVTFKTWSISLTVAIPFIQQMNGNQNAGGYRVRLGIIKTF